MLRLAFAGQHVYFGYCALQEAAGGVEPRFFDWRPEGDPDALLLALREFAPDVVVCWRPELFPPGLLRELDAVTVGFLTEPLPRPGEPSHPDLEARMATLGEVDAAQFDRTIAFNAEIIPAAERVLPVWRSVPIPVADAGYRPVRDPVGAPRILFTGRSTEHRESYLGPIKHDYDVVHLAHGVTEDRLQPFLDEVDAGLNLHNEDYPTYENRVSAYLAAGLLVLSEPLSPRHGLRPRTDLIEVRGPWELWEVCRALQRAPHAFRSVRLAGRASAERFRASRVWPRLAREAVADVGVFGAKSLP